MSRPPTRHSRRLGQQPPSPPVELPPNRARRVRAPSVGLAYAEPSLHDGAASPMDVETPNADTDVQNESLLRRARFFPLHRIIIISVSTHTSFGSINGYDPVIPLNAQDTANFQYFFNSTEEYINSSFTGSSPSYRLAAISETTPFSPDASIAGSPSAPSPLALHSPRAVYPLSRSGSWSDSSFVLGAASSSPHDARQDIPPQASLSDVVTLTTSVPPQPPLGSTPVLFDSDAPPGNPGRGSLADVRMRLLRAQTPAVRAIPSRGSLYIGFPFHANLGRRNFFYSGFELTSGTPSLFDLIQVGRGQSSVLAEICADLVLASFLVASSRTMLEVHDPTFSATANGYCVLGLLSTHLHSSQVVMQAAHPNATSLATFNMNDVPQETPLFVLYIFPEHIQIPRAVTAIIPRPAGSRSRSETPAPAVIPQFLSCMLKTHSALDQHFLQEGYQLSALLEPHYGGAYLKIRQTLIIEDVHYRAKDIIPALTRHDVAGWAGLKPATYSNNRTFATDARATLQFLRARANSTATRDQSADLRQKEADLVRFLGGCFATAPLSQDWDAAQASPDALTIGGANKKTVENMVAPYRRYSTAYKDQRFTVVEGTAY
ncbi:hypothetical protein C8R47DRAFT_1228106 [Mycena vitilis]|nr:hypothetical protein C8R47DRAFT_1228106 [Mycena vitilis]